MCLYNLLLLLLLCILMLFISFDHHRVLHRCESSLCTIKSPTDISHLFNVKSVVGLLNLRLESLAVIFETNIGVTKYIKHKGYR